MTPTPGLPYEWDEDKREYTLRIRGVAFVIVEQADWTAAIHRRSDRGGEFRYFFLRADRGPALQRGLDAKRFPYPHHQPQEGEREGDSQV